MTCYRSIGGAGKLNYIGASRAEMQAEPRKPEGTFNRGCAGDRRVRDTPASAEANARALLRDLPAGCLAEAVPAFEEQTIAIGLQDHLVPVPARRAEELLKPEHRCPPAGGAALVFDGNRTTESLKGQSSHEHHSWQDSDHAHPAQTADLGAVR